MPAASRNILALNCGSSSLKFGLYRVMSGDASLLCEGEAEEIGGTHGQFWFRSEPARSKQRQALAFRDHSTALHHAFGALTESGLPRPDAVGHRFVHGGPTLRNHHLVGPETVRSLEASVPFAPLHLPAALAVLMQVQDQRPEVPQAVCLDTAFHRTLPDVSRWFALPGEVARLGVERYGFHGLSLESILAQMSEVPEGS